MDDHRLDWYRYAFFNVGFGGGKTNAIFWLLNKFKQSQKEVNMFGNPFGSVPGLTLGIDNESKYRDVTISKKVNNKDIQNGWIVQVGCATFVETSWDKICKVLKEYWDDPVKAEKKYYKK